MLHASGSRHRIFDSPPPTETTTTSDYSYGEQWRFKIWFNPPFFLKCLYQVRVITVFTVFRLLTDFVCLYTYEFWLSLCKIARSSVILLLPLSTTGTTGTSRRSMVQRTGRQRWDCHQHFSFRRLCYRVLDRSKQPSAMESLRQWGPTYQQPPRGMAR
jgi:hypothetical protein